METTWPLLWFLTLIAVNDLTLTLTPHLLSTNPHTQQFPDLQWLISYMFIKKRNSLANKPIIEKEDTLVWTVFDDDRPGRFGVRGNAVAGREFSEGIWVGSRPLGYWEEMEGRSRDSSKFWGTGEKDGDMKWLWPGGICEGRGTGTGIRLEGSPVCHLSLSDKLWFSYSSSSSSCGKVYESAGF